MTTPENSPAPAAPRSVAALEAALADPPRHAEYLAAACNDRGLRDALLMLAGRAGDWTGLRQAAAGAGLEAVATGEHSVYGPLTVLGVARWMSPGGQRDPEVPLMWATVPETDPAVRLAYLSGRLHARGFPPSAAADRFAHLDPQACVAFLSPPAGRPAAPPPHMITDWFAMDAPLNQPAVEDPLLVDGTADLDLPPARSR